MLKIVNSHYSNLTPNQKISTLIAILKEKRAYKIKDMKNDIRVYLDNIMTDRDVFQSNKYKKRLSKIIKHLYNQLDENINKKHLGEESLDKLEILPLFLRSLLKNQAHYDTECLFFTYKKSKVQSLFILTWLLAQCFGNQLLDEKETIFLFQKILDSHPNYQEQKIFDANSDCSYDIWSYIAEGFSSSFLKIIFDNFKHLKFYIPKKNSFAPQFIGELYDQSVEQIDILNSLLDDFITRNHNDLNAGMENEQFFHFPEKDAWYIDFTDKDLSTKQIEHFNIIYICLIYGNKMLIDKVFNLCKGIFNQDNFKSIQDLIITNFFITPNEKIEYLEKIPKQIDYYSMTQATWGSFVCENPILVDYLLQFFDLHLTQEFFTGDNLLLSNMGIAKIEKEYHFDKVAKSYIVRKKKTFYMNWSEYFIEKGIPIISNKQGIHPIHKMLVYKESNRDKRRMLMTGSDYVLKIWNLLKLKNVDFNVKSNRGNNALHFAFSMNFDIENILFLIEEKVKLSEKNKYGKTAYDYFLKNKEKIKKANNDELVEEFSIIEKQYLEETLSNNSHSKGNNRKI